MARLENGGRQTHSGNGAFKQADFVEAHSHGQRPLALRAKIDGAALLLTTVYIVCLFFSIAAYRQIIPLAQRMQKALVEQCAIRFTLTNKRIEIPVVVLRETRLEKHALAVHLPRVKKALLAQTANIRAKENFKRKLRQTLQGIALRKEPISRPGKLYSLAVWAIDHARIADDLQRPFTHLFEIV